MVEFTKDELWILRTLLEQKVEYGGSVDIIKNVIRILEKIEIEVFNEEDENRRICFNQSLK